MASRAQVVIDLIVNSSGASKELDQTASKFSKVQGALSKAALPAAAVVTAIGGIAAAAGKAASDTQQAFGGLDAVFGKNAETVKGWANDAATSVGLSASAYAEFAAKIGAQLKNAGLPMDQVASKTDDLIKLGSDLAATYGGTTADAVDALSAALRGEADPAERYGLALNQTAINAKMAADGTDKLTGSAKTQAKTAAVLAMATEQAGGAIGQFARESDSAAGSAQIAQAQWQNALSTLGTVLLPIMAAAATKMAQLGQFVQQNARAFQILAAVVGGIAAAILLANAAMAAFQAITLAVRVATLAWTAAQWLLNVALTANPIGIVIIAIVAMIAAIVLLWTKCEGFRNAVMAVWGALKTGWSAVVAAFQAGVAFIVAAWQRILSVATVVVSAVIAFAKGMAYPYIQAFRLIQAIAGVVFQVIRIGFELIKAVASAVASSIKSVFVAGWNAIKAATSVLVAWVKSKITSLTAPARAAANQIKAVFVAGWNAIKSAAASMASSVMSKVRAMLGPIKSVASAIKSGLVSAFNALKSAGSRALSAITAPFRALAGAVESVISKVRSLVSALSRIHVPKISLPKLGGSSRSAALMPQGYSLRSPSEAPTVRQAGYLGAGGGTGNGQAMINITVNGALDPEAVARQIERVLSSAQRRRQGVTLRQRASTVAAPV